MFTKIKVHRGQHADFWAKITCQIIINQGFSLTKHLLFCEIFKVFDLSMVVQIGKYLHAIGIFTVFFLEGIHS